MKQKGAPVDAYGMQGHFELGEDSIPQIRETFDELRKLGIKVVVSELDIDVVTRSRWWADNGKYREELAEYDPYKYGLPEAIQRKQMGQYVELFKLFANCGCAPEAADESAAPQPGAKGKVSLKQLLCCLPQVQVPPHVTYENVFRLIIMQFLDPHNFDVRSVKKSCVHIVHPDGRVIPFDTYNLFYRDGKERGLDRLRTETVPLGLPSRLSTAGG